jgi:hypothetical protein
VQRRREIACSPQRSAGEAWQVVAELVAVTLERSPSIERSTVDAAMDTVGGVGRMLVAGGHLESAPITVVAGQLWLEIVTVSGDRALTIEENLNAVPGAATADDWKVHFPAEGPLSKLIKDAAKKDDHLTADEPVVPTTSESQQTVGALNESALANWAEEKP